MKKIVFFVVIIIVIVSSIFVTHSYYQSTLRELKKENSKFDYCYNNEITGTDVATLINKAIDSNSINDVQKDSNNKYIQNDQNSIVITIHMLDTDTVYDMESIYLNDITKFLEFYGSIKFKCSNVEYHDKTKKVKSLYFEQVTQ
ncbi:hypothetical protein D3C72_1810040 [compost metagenome]